MKKGYIGIFFFAIVLAAGGCQKQNKDVEPESIWESTETLTPLEETTPAAGLISRNQDEIEELADLNLWKQSPEFDFYDEPAILKIYTYADISEDGEGSWDDGQRWAVTLEMEAGSFLLFHQYVQNAVLEANAMFLYEGDVWKVLVRSNGHISYDIYEYTFDEVSQSFIAEPAYTSGASLYNYGTETIY